jgi:uncharacterized protein
VAELEALVGFARELRAAGLGPGTGAVEDFCRATALLGIEHVYWAGRATLVSGREEIEVYDRVFAGRFGAADAPRPPRAQPRLRLVEEDDTAGDGEEGRAQAPLVARASRIELLRRKTFDRCSADELAELARLAAALARDLPRRRSRRRGNAAEGALDVRATLRRSLRTGGEPFERRFRARREAERPLVLLLDVSGSMRGSSRALLVLAHALVRARPRVEVFCFGTRLTRVTRALAGADPDEALRRAADAVEDWEGGTRIGEAVKAFLDRAGHRGAARGAVVVVYSDGLDVGDPELLRAQMARLARLAHRVVWLNPLKQDPAYEPLARGMSAALPHVDVFAAGTTLASLEEVTLRVAGGR